MMRELSTSDIGKMKSSGLPAVEALFFYTFVVSGLARSRPLIWWLSLQACRLELTWSLLSTGTMETPNLLNRILGLLRIFNGSALHKHWQILLISSIQKMMSMVKNFNGWSLEEATQEPFQLGLRASTQTTQLLPGLHQEWLMPYRISLNLI